MTTATPGGTERELRLLEAELKRLEVDYNKFFSGRLRRQPLKARDRIEALVRKYDRAHITNHGDRFLFQTLQLRFVSLKNLWDRGLRAIEEGRPGPFSRRQATKVRQP
jgi:hypothetical protein